jgi:hypothetical protein
MKKEKIKWFVIEFKNRLDYNHKQLQKRLAMEAEK